VQFRFDDDPVREWLLVGALSQHLAGKFDLGADALPSYRLGGGIVSTSTLARTLTKYSRMRVRLKGQSAVYEFPLPKSTRRVLADVFSRCGRTLGGG